MRTNVPATMRALRVRRRWRQDDLAERAELSREVVSRAERGLLDGITLRSLERLCAALEATLVVEIRWRGAELDRLVDRVHARLQEETARRLQTAGWIVRAEVSFNHYGDRGSCDLIAWHPATRTLLIAEVKSRLGNVQESLRRLDVKARIGPALTQELGWGRPSAALRALVLAEDSTNRRVVERHAALFERFGVRGRSVNRWLRDPNTSVGGLLWFHQLSDSHDSRTTDSIRVRSSRRAG